MAVVSAFRTAFSSRVIGQAPSRMKPAPSGMKPAPSGMKLAPSGMKPAPSGMKPALQTSSRTSRIKLKIPAVGAVPTLPHELFLQRKLASRKRVAVTECFSALGAVGIGYPELERAFFGMSRLVPQELAAALEPPEQDSSVRQATQRMCRREPANSLVRYN